MCTAWIALQDTDLRNGGMRTIVGSHKWGLLEDSNTFGHKDLDGLQARFASQEISGEWLDEPCIMQAGQVSFHHALTLHGSGPNLTWEPRMCLISHMMPGGTTYVPGRQFHPNLVYLGPNRARRDSPSPAPTGPKCGLRPAELPREKNKKGESGILSPHYAPTANLYPLSPISPVARSSVSCTSSSCAGGRAAACRPRIVSTKSVSSRSYNAWRVCVSTGTIVSPAS